jgi:hypothetical protein
MRRSFINALFHLYLQSITQCHLLNIKMYFITLYRSIITSNRYIIRYRLLQPKQKV